jgi:hypothetical protein
MLGIKSGIWDSPVAIETNAQQSFSKAKVLLLQVGAQPTRSLVGKKMNWEVHSGFIADKTLLLTRIILCLGSQCFMAGYYLR